MRSRIPGAPPWHALDMRGASTQIHTYNGHPPPFAQSVDPAACAIRAGRARIRLRESFLRKSLRSQHLHTFAQNIALTHSQFAQIARSRCANRVVKSSSGFHRTWSPCTATLSLEAPMRVRRSWSRAKCRHISSRPDTFRANRAAPWFLHWPVSTRRHYSSSAGHGNWLAVPGGNGDSTALPAIRRPSGIL